MAQRDSGFTRVKDDLYQTPEWVAHALAEVVPIKGLKVWEPAAGEGKLARGLIETGAAVVYQTDVVDRLSLLCQRDFRDPAPFQYFYDAIITNPPFSLDEAFIERGLELMGGGILALLFKSDFDAAAGRRRFFADCPDFAGKIVLTKRIWWFPDFRPFCKACGGDGTVGLLNTKCKNCGGKGWKKTGPSENHAWFIWRKPLGGRQEPKTWYAPAPVELMTACSFPDCCSQRTLPLGSGNAVPLSQCTCARAAGRQHVGAASEAEV